MTESSANAIPPSTAQLIDNPMPSARPSAPSANPPTVEWLALGDMNGTSSADAPLLLRDTSPLRQVKVTLQVRVGEVEMRVGELLDARKEQVLVLDRALDQPIDLVLEGQVVARGQLVALGEHFAVRITELPRPLEPQIPAAS